MSVDWLHPQQNCRHSLFWRAKQRLQRYFPYLLDGGIVDTLGDSTIHKHRILAIFNDSEWIPIGFGMGLGFFLCGRSEIHRIDRSDVGLHICIFIGLGQNNRPLVAIFTAIIDQRSTIHNRGFRTFPRSDFHHFTGTIPRPNSRRHRFAT